MAFQYAVSIDDPKNELGDQSGLVRQNVEAALAGWSAHLEGIGTLILIIEVKKTEVGRFAGASYTSHRVGEKDGLPLMEDSAPYKLRSGARLHERGDAFILIPPAYLREQVWLDPEPFDRRRSVPVDQLDSVSLFTHELAHCFGVAGWIDPKTGGRKCEKISMFDSHVVCDEGRFYFIGEHTVALYGGRLPLTHRSETQNVYHYGDRGDSKPDIVHGLLNGIEFKYGCRYRITPLDLAILRDIRAKSAPKETHITGTQ